MLQEAKNHKSLPENVLESANSMGLGTVELRRLERIIRHGIKFLPDDCFSDPVWVKKVMEARVDIEPGSPPTHEQHIILFSKLQYYRFILSRLRKKILTHDKVNPCLLRAILVWDSRQCKLRDYITTSNMGLVLNMAQRCKYTNIEYGELVSEGAMALLRVTECFDYRLGFHFSTYACRAISKSYSRLVKKQYKACKLGTVTFDPAMEMDTTCQQLRQQRVIDSVRQLRYYILGKDGNLSEIEKRILKLRFSVGEYKGNPMTLKDVGLILGLSKERIRQIQNQAVVKLGRIVQD